MPRALTIERSKVASHERDDYFAGLRQRRDRLKAAECNFWVYEDPGEPGLFIEFTEARDAETLVAGTGRRVGGRGQRSDPDRSGAFLIMPTRTISAEGKEWRVFPSGLRHAVRARRVRAHVHRRDGLGA